MHLNRDLPEFELSLKIKDNKFLQTLLGVEKNWLLQKTLKEFVEDLVCLDKNARSFNRGSVISPDNEDWKKSSANYQEDKLVIGNTEVMCEWERPLMEAMARGVTETHGDVLEVGFGMGISATYIQSFGVKSHTIVEYNDNVFKVCKQWREQYPDRDIQLIHSKWQDAVEQLDKKFDGIFYDIIPTSDEEETKNLIEHVAADADPFFPWAASCLKDGGIFTYYTQELDSLSRRHQRLLFQYFSSFSVHLVRGMNPPEDCEYWYSDSMAVVKAIK